VIGRVAAVLALACVAACTTPSSERNGDRTDEAAPPTTAALVQRILAEEPAARTEAEGWLVAAGPEVVPDLLAAAETAEGEGRIRLLAVVADLDAWPDDLGAGLRADVLLWRLGGGNGGPSDRARALLQIAGLDASVRTELAERAGREGQDRTLAIYALARTGDPGAVAILSGALEGGSAETREAAAEGLLHMTGVDWRRADERERAELLETWSRRGGRQG
jgi:HEAT repeat protein